MAEHQVTRKTDLCSGHGCWPPRPPAQWSPDVFINGLNVIRETDLYVPHCCFIGSTEISLLSGNTRTIEDLYENGYENEYVYSATKEGKVVPGKIKNCWITKETTELVKVVLDNQKEILCTPDHQFMLRNGMYKEAQHLTSQDSLMPLYIDQDKKGYPIVLSNDTMKYRPVHKIVAQEYKPGLKEAKLRLGKGKNKFVVVHHKDFNKKNNNPDNLLYLGNVDHFSYHSELTKLTWQNRSEEELKQIKIKLSKASKIQQKEKLLSGTHNFQTDHPMKKLKNKLKLVERTKAAAAAGRHVSQINNPMRDPVVRKKVSDTKKKLFSKGLLVITKMSDEQREKCSIRMKKNNPMKNPSAMKKSIAGKMKTSVLRIQKFYQDKGYQATTEKSWSEARLAHSHELPKQFRYTWDTFLKYSGNNHRILSVTKMTLANPVKVYDIEISNTQNTHNFALAAGPFVHNCVGCHTGYAYNSCNVYANGLHIIRQGDPITCGSHVRDHSPDTWVGNN